MVRILVLAGALSALTASSGSQEPPRQLPGSPTDRLEPGVQERLRLEDADRDAWQGEILQQRAGAALKELSAAWKAGRLAEAGMPLATGFRAGPLPPWPPPDAVRQRDGQLTALSPAARPATVAVAPPDAAATAPPDAAAAAGPGADAFAGPAGLRAHFERLRSGFDDCAPLRVKFKIHGVAHVDEAAWRTRVQVHLLGRADGRLEEAVAEWILAWDWDGGDAAPLLRALDAESIQVALGPEGGGTPFVDRTAALFADPALYHGQLAPGLDDWQRRIAAGLGFSSRSQQGIAVGDFDGDGREDLYLAQPAGLPNLLLRRRADGRLEDVAAQAGVDFLDSTRAALLVDLDNDGDLDLVVSLAAELVFLENDGGRFRKRASGSVPESTMLAAADYDGDGWLDVYACRYLNPYEDQGVPLPYHDAENGYPNVLLDHDGDWVLRDVTDQVGLGANNSRFSFAAAWEDFDDDGDQDLYVANDFGRNNLYRNDGGRFVDIAAEAGVEDISAGMGVAWGDYDGDGRMDLYVSNMYSSAGKRVAYQRRFQPAADAVDLAAMRRHARGNSLFRNRGDGGFEDVSERAGVTMGRWAWGAVFTDFGNDGLLDLYVPNGFLTRSKPDDL